MTDGDGEDAVYFMGMREGREESADIITRLRERVKELEVALIACANALETTLPVWDMTNKESYAAEVDRARAALRTEGETR